MQSFEAYIILLSFCIISVISANHTNHTTNVPNTTNAPNTTTEANIDVMPAQNILWSRLENYTCKDLMPAINIFYNISQSECESRCLSFFNNSMQCTAAVWYEYIKPTGNDVPRCYLFGQSCELEVVFEKPVTSSFWYYNITHNFNCVNYPNNWKDNFFDDCDTYSLFNFCDYAYNSSTTAILSYQDTIYGFDALQVCCGCNGGLFNYNDRFLFEPKWKPTSILNIYGDYTDFVCEAVDIAATTSILVDEAGILDQHKFNFTQFVGLCQHLHASLYDKYKLLLSISADNNDLINAKNIYSDFSKFTQFDCVKNLLLNNVTICNHTDENNLYPFIIDLEEDHIYINNHFINSETFVYHLPPTNVNIKSFCSFSMFLNTTFPTKPPTKEPTFEPTMQPTVNPTNEPTINPTQITSNPTRPPTNDPTYEPTFEPTTIPTSEPTYEPTKIPTKIPTNDPTHEPTFEPTNNPTNVPSNEPTPDTVDPTDSPSFEPTFEPSFEPTVEPTKARRRLLNHYYSTPYFKTNIMAAFLCQTGYTESPTLSPTKYPTIPPTQSSREVEYDTTLEIDESSSGNDTKPMSGGAVAGVVFAILLFCILICGLIYCFVIKKRAPKAIVELGRNVNAVPPPDMDEREQEEQKTDVPGPIPGMLEMQMVATYESEMDYSWKGKRMRSWTNAEILDWIKCMNLGVWQDEILNVIESNGITGEDIVELKSSDDVGEAFEITGNKGLCTQIFKGIKDFKANLKGGNDRFRVNMFVGNEHLTLDEEVEKTDTIKKIKTMYKIQERIDFELNHIHFRYKRKELLDNKTLQQYGITNEKHLIEVELDKVFPIYIFAQGVNLTLNQKVTKDYKIQQIKEMYKSQSGVYANLQDIQFYKKSNLLESNKTLAQCGIVDDKHLISVRFETAGGGDSNI